MSRYVHAKIDNNICGYLNVNVEPRSATRSPIVKVGYTFTILLTNHQNAFKCQLGMQLERYYQYKFELINMN